MLNDIGEQSRDEGLVDVILRAKDIFKGVVQPVDDVLFGVDVDMCIHDGVKAAEVVNAEDVVGVIVCVNDAVDVHDVVADHLVTEIGGGVDEVASVVAGEVVVFNHDTGTVAVVAWVIGGADFAVACDDGYTGAGACAEEC